MGVDNCKKTRGWMMKKMIEVSITHSPTNPFLLPLPSKIQSALLFPLPPLPSHCVLFSIPALETPKKIPSFPLLCAQIGEIEPRLFKIVGCFFSVFPQNLLLFFFCFWLLLLRPGSQAEATSDVALARVCRYLGAVKRRY